MNITNIINFKFTSFPNTGLFRATLLNRLSLDASVSKRTKNWKLFFVRLYRHPQPGKHVFRSTQMCVYFDKLPFYFYVFDVSNKASKTIVKLGKVPHAHQ